MASPVHAVEQADDLVEAPSPPWRRRAPGPPHDGLTSAAFGARTTLAEGSGEETASTAAEADVVGRLEGV
jgi:hypothetical protein